MIRKLLVANRGEIALRVMRSAKEMGIATVAVYSEADRNAAHVAYADEAYLIGPAQPAQSYLNVARVLDAAVRAGADALHPGYGFLSENAGFARAVVEAGLTWVGPHAGAIEAMGDKLRARQAMLAAGVPIVPGGVAAVTSVDEAAAAAAEFGLPIAIKASGGGGGKGLKVAHTVAELASALATARREAEAYFGDGTLYVERYLHDAKHVELQLLADKHGAVVHVGERDCSLQRRHQKLLEETPALIDPDVRRRLREAGVRAARSIGYDSVGTIETLVQGNEFFFLEMNTRIQVEHTISEMTSGIDLIREQLRVAAGEPLGYGQDAIDLRGHAIEVRVNAENPADDFRPSPGALTEYREPAGLGIRVDSAASAGFVVTPDYDSMIAKLIVAAPTRDQALARLRRAIDDYRIAGVPTTLPFLRALIDTAPVVSGTYGTSTLEAFARGYVPAVAAGARNGAPATEADAAEVVRVEVNDRLYFVRLLDAPRTTQSGSARQPLSKRRTPAAARNGPSAGAASSGSIVAPMHGVVVEIAVAPGQLVRDGEVVAVIEAMKMMNEIYAPRAGKVARVLVERGVTVEANTPLVEFEDGP